MFIQFTVSVFRERLSIYVCASLPFGFEGRMWDLIVIAPDHCLYFYFGLIELTRTFMYFSVFWYLLKPRLLTWVSKAYYTRRPGE